MAASNFVQSSRSKRSTGGTIIRSAAVRSSAARAVLEISAERNYNEAILRSMSNAVLTLDAEGVLRKVNAKL